jgi:hypothetical protein
VNPPRWSLSEKVGLPKMEPLGESGATQDGAHPEKVNLPRMEFARRTWRPQDGALPENVDLPQDGVPGEREYPFGLFTHPEGS